jgi:hypothetical protein
MDEVVQVEGSWSGPRHLEYLDQYLMLAKDQIRACNPQMIVSRMTRVEHVECSRCTGGDGDATSGPLQEALSVVRRSLGVMKDVM